MKKIIFAGLVFFSQAALADGVSSLRDFYSKTNAMRAQFSQVVNDAQGRKIQEVQGTMQLYRPNKFRWDYKKPYEQQIVSDGKQVFLYDVDLQQVTVREISKALSASPASLLAGGAALDENFTLSNEARSDDLTWVQVLPKEKDSGFDKVFLGFKADKLQKMELHDSFKHITHISFKAVERNPALQNSVFIFTPPKGVDIVGE
ncbi:MAG TPA: outer membrane lipoprotein chaperone LolA [Methylotenera sp.]|nr:outer membrane lipoprotein chaperone LolA [Methylotenera sp.]HPH04355.1 outer membrane lipoprotein chaperone LolA [Methylotenera sp.]HPM99909.1 outer membrane lipoprotein chaperone LolA [Methylotenera sp.]